MSVKLMSSTEHATVEVNGDKTALIFKSGKCEAGIYWPMKDWGKLVKFVESQLVAFSQTTTEEDT